MCGLIKLNKNNTKQIKNTGGEQTQLSLKLEFQLYGFCNLEWLIETKCSIQYPTKYNNRLQSEILERWLEVTYRIMCQVSITVVTVIPEDEEEKVEKNNQIGKMGLVEIEEILQK